MSRVGIVASDQFNRRIEDECPGANAKRSVWILGLGVRLALLWKSTDRTELHRWRSWLTGRNAAGNVAGFIGWRRRGRHRHARRYRLRVRRYLGFRPGFDFPGVR